MRRSSLALFLGAFCAGLVVEGGGGGGGGNSNWRQCCEYAFNPRCKGGCRKAKSRGDLEHTCLADQDFSVFNCLEKQDVGLKCCSKELSSKCLSACRAVFVKDQWPSDWDLHQVGERCTPGVIACIENYTRSHPARNMADSLPCCDDQAVSETCRSKCRTALNTLTKEEEAIDEVLRYCGVPDLTSSLWQCFLRRSTGNRREVINVASIRLGCCRKASSTQCRNLCVKNYHLRHLAFTDEFDQRCLYSPLENDLSVCLEEVENRCEPGCNDLKYCSNFNGRPEISFRSCHLQSDIGAQQIVQLWSLGTIMKSSVFNFDIPIKNIGQCGPNKWKAIACTMFIKPCHPKSLTGSICRSDCMDVLTKCLDPSRITQPGVTAETICDKLSPRNGSSACISLSLYSSRNLTII